MSKKPSHTSRTRSQPATDVRAALLGVQLEGVSLTLALMPHDQPGRDEALIMLDEARELLRQLHPGAIDPNTTRIMSAPAQLSDLH